MRLKDIGKSGDFIGDIESCITQQKRKHHNGTQTIFTVHFDDQENLTFRTKNFAINHIIRQLIGLQYAGN